jgi:hypothetical protein
MVALDVGRLARLADLGDHDIDPARGEIHRRGQSDGAGAYHEHLGLYLPHLFSLVGRIGLPGLLTASEAEFHRGASSVGKYLAGSDASD